MCVFEIEYCESGEKKTRRVEGQRLAMKLAKELAVETGKRTVLRRLPGPVPRDWTVFLLDLDTGELDRIWEGMTKHQVLQRWRIWDERGTGLAIVAWPHPPSPTAGKHPANS
jgi:hypothetical protein